MAKLIMETHNLEKKSKEAQYGRSMFEASIDPMVVINFELIILDSNKAFTNITGLKREALKNTCFTEYFIDSNKANEVLKTVSDKNPVANLPLDIKDQKNKIINLLINASLLRNEKGKILGVVIVARDITEQIRISVELTEAIVFAELATGIAEEAKMKADEARKVAEEAVKAKQQFLSNMSHEIRTPMNAIIGFTKVLLKSDLTPKQEEYLTAIKTSGDALIVLINDILDLSKVDAGKMVFEEVPFRITDSISAMLHLFELKAQEKNIRLIKIFDPEIPHVLLGDAVRLHQIMINLVGNAIKFTKEGAITVSLHLLEDNEDSVLIKFEVSDTGIGINEEKMTKIFENFQQATSGTSRLFGGTGLGLAISKQLVEAQGGSIAVKSIIDEGSTFNFTLTFKKTQKDAPNEPVMTEPNNRTKEVKVLVVEDLPLNQLLMRTILEDFGFECDIAVNGKIAIEKVQNNSYDVILMDLQMPEMNGFEATEYIRKHLNKKVPIIALTADVTTTDLARCKTAGMNDYVSKPLDERLLKSKILFFLRKATFKKQNQLKNTQFETPAKKYINLEYLLNRTKSNPILMSEMITLYLGQTKSLIAEMMETFQDKDWKGLNGVAHRMIPSFSIVGIAKEYEAMAKDLMAYTQKEDKDKEIQPIVLKLKEVLTCACDEVEAEIKLIKI